MLILKRILVVLLGVLIGWTLANANVTSAEAAPRTETIVNYPKYAGGSMASSYANLNRLDRMVNETPRGATIYISMFSANRWAGSKGSQPGENLMIDLVRAHRRGVNVRYVTWTNDHFREVIALEKALGRDIRKRSWVKECRGACLAKGNSGNHHTKAFTFSRTGGRNYVTVIMSGNLTRASAERQWNESSTIVNDKKIYQAVSTNIWRMRLDKWQGKQATVVSGPRKVFFFPQPGKADDPVLQAVKATRCKYGPRNSKRSKIYVAMAFWSGKRNDFTSALVTKRKQGCDVQVVISKGLSTKAVETKLKKGKVKTWNSMPNSQNYGHQKSVFIGGLIGGRGRAVSFTGSANMTGAAQDQDEILLQTEGWNEFSVHMPMFKKMQSKSKRLW